MTIIINGEQVVFVRFEHLGNPSETNNVTSANISVVMLVNDNNISVKIMTYGAAIIEFLAPDRHGIFKNIAMSLSPLSQYIRGASYAGATIGPNAGRIRDGHLLLGRDTYTLSQNEGVNQLHGGFYNFSYSLWSIAELAADDSKASLTLELRAQDGLDGYPGERTASVTYALDNSNTLSVTFGAVTDKPTWMNLSNHTYWNPSGDFSHPATGQSLMINAQTVLYNDSENLPFAFHAVDNSPFDFRSLRCIRNQLAAFPGSEQIQKARGYNNAYSLDTSGPAAVLYDEESGRRITIDTDYPSLVFYSGGFLDDSITLEGGLPASASCALALEAQEFPDALHLADPMHTPEALHIPEVPRPILCPGDTWQRYIRFAFDVT